MRITQIMLAKGFGGAERFFLDLALALADRGHFVQTICHRDFANQSALMSHPQVNHLAIPVMASWDLLAVRRILKALQCFDPAVVHAHLARGAHLGGLAARRSGIPVIVKTHTKVSLKYYQHVDHFVATTGAQQDYLLNCGIPEQQISIIPNFSAFAIGPIRDAGSGPTKLLSYGRMVPKKGFDVLLRATALLLRDGADIELQLGGDGPERRPLEQLAKTLGIIERVAFVGWIEDIRECLLAADVFVLPSREEPFGIAVLEAMACRIPILATRCDGPTEILNPETAAFAEPGDEHSLGKALRDLLESDGQNRRRANAAADKFARLYTPEAVTPQYLARYQALLAG